MPATARKIVRRQVHPRETAAEARLRREEEEDRLDAADLAKALAEPGERPYEEVRRDLGLK